MSEKSQILFSSVDINQEFDLLAARIIHVALGLNMNNDEIASLISECEGYLSGTLSYQIALNIRARAMDIMQKYIENLNNS